MKSIVAVVSLLAALVGIIGFILGLPESIPRVKALLEGDRFYTARRQLRANIVSKLFSQKMYATKRSIKYEVYQSQNTDGTKTIHLYRTLEKTIQNLGKDEDEYRFKTVYSKDERTELKEVRINNKTIDLRNCGPVVNTQTREVTYECNPDNLSPGQSIEVEAKYLVKSTLLDNFIYEQPDVSRDLVLEQTKLEIGGDPLTLENLDIVVQMNFEESLVEKLIEGRTWVVNDYLLPFQGFFVRIKPIDR